MTKNDITIITLADKVYYQYLIPLLHSANKHFNSAWAEVYLVDFDHQESPISICEEIRAINPKYNVTFLSSLPNVDLECYCTNARADLFYTLRRKTDNILFWLDADSIIRSSCDELIKHLSSCELTMNHKSEIRFKAGVIGMGSSDICRDFTTRYRSLVSSEYNDWFANQKYLNKTYSEFKDRINFKPLPDKYCDTRLTDKGVIWAAQSENKSDSKYVGAMNNALGD